MPQTKTMTINMGPQHPSTHGVLRLVLELDGEVVVKVTPHIGYLHTGMEKIMESKRYQQAITVTDRFDYLAPMSNNLAFVLSVEKLLGIEVPARAKIIRVLFAELTRIKSHLVALGTMALEIGAQSVFLYCFREREKILDLYEMVSGARMMSSYFRVGGLMADLPEGFDHAVQQILREFPHRFDEYEDLLTRNPLWLQRLKGIGIIKAEDAIEWGLSGPNLRACGVPWDLRESHPYSGYEQFDFTIALGQAGDSYDRYVVRVFEMRQSLKIAEQALKEPNRYPDPMSLKLRTAIGEKHGLTAEHVFVGNEVAGVGAPVLDECSRHLSLPMLGVKDSLNVAVAFGIAAFAAARAIQR